MRAIWKDTVIADSDSTVVVEGNHYFPPESVRWEFLTKSDSHTVCHWKGVASYYIVKVGDAENPDAAWTYPNPSPAAAGIASYLAFWRGVIVRDAG